MLFRHFSYSSISALSPGVDADWVHHVDRRTAQEERDASAMPEAAKRAMERTVAAFMMTVRIYRSEARQYQR